MKNMKIKSMAEKSHELLEAINAQKQRRTNVYDITVRLRVRKKREPS